MSTQTQTNAEIEYFSAMQSAGVPEHLQGGLMRYLVHRIPPGHFLTAVLSNDLKEAMGRADEASRAGLYQIVSFLYNDAPAPCWGTPGKVWAWLNGEAI